MRITSKGQVTIPIAIRQKAGLRPYMDVRFEFRDGVVTLSRGKPSKRQQALAAHLKRMRGAGTVKMTTDEIMRLTRGE